jgi:hypothetical protein
MTSANRSPNHAPERLDLLEFQQQNRFHQRTLIKRKPAGPFKRVGIVVAGRTNQWVFVRNIASY